MIQAIGLTGALGDQGPAVDDLTFQASPGQVTVLFGGPGAGKTHAVRLMLRLARAGARRCSAAAPCTASPTLTGRWGWSWEAPSATRGAPSAAT